MKISYQWLQSYFEEKLPEPKELAELFNLHFAEVETMEKVDDDTVFDIDVLPNRAGYALSHGGVAYEVGAILDYKVKNSESKDIDSTSDLSVEVNIDRETKCRRYIARRITNVSVQESPEWIKKRLEVVGQKSISNIVDATNYVMLNTGQPLHAFDASKVKGTISVRFAQKGEKITTLDGAEAELTGEDVVIADEEGVLAIAGVKGGKKAEVDENTTDIILESANFDPVFVRRTSGRVGIKTDSSKRFENDPTPELAMRALGEVTELVVEFSGSDVSLGKINDSYLSKDEPVTVKVSLSRIRNRLGADIPDEEIVNLLGRLGFAVSGTGDEREVEVPSFRRDVGIEEDVTEEVGRLYGLHNIKSELPERWPNPFETDRETRDETKLFLYQLAICRALAGAGYIEMYGYAFRDSGDLKVLKSLASDKEYLRTDLSSEIEEKLALNREHLLFDTEPVKLFEVGRVFPESGEEPRVAFGAMYKKKKQSREEENTKQALEEIISVLELDITADELLAKVFKKTVNEDARFVYEGSVYDIIELSATTPKLQPVKLSEDRFRPISVYPRIIRDVAIFVPPEVEAETPLDVIKKEACKSELLAADPVLFDVFDKKGEDGQVEKRSLAYRLVFQSHDRTLSDDEVNGIMDGVYKVLEGMNWEVR